MESNNDLDDDFYPSYTGEGTSGFLFFAILTHLLSNILTYSSSTEISSTYFILSTHCYTMIFPIALNIIILITDFNYNPRCD